MTETMHDGGATEANSDLGRTEKGRTTLRVERLSKSYPTPSEPLVVLDELTFSLAGGDSLAVTGPSGCGKSTLLHVVGALDQPTSGSVLLGDVDASALSEPELARFRNRRIGFVFQEHYLLPQCDVVENVLVPTLVGDGDAVALEQRALQLLERVGLGARLGHRPAELSGGERQRVAIARALIHAPDLVLCDEPTGNLDAVAATSVTELLLELHAESGGILIVVTHSQDVARRLGRHATLEAGTLRFQEA